MNTPRLDAELVRCKGCRAWFWNPLDGSECEVSLSYPHLCSDCIGQPLGKRLVAKKPTTLEDFEKAYKRAQIEYEEAWRPEAGKPRED
jgi:hypothetical protein